jgi:hypothetical protein
MRAKHRTLTPEMVSSEKFRARFWEKVDKDGPGGCWLWTRGKDSWGYGNIALERTVIGEEGAPTKAHRASWVMANDEALSDFCVLHHCDVPSCVNPDHLWLGTDADNMADRDQKGRGNQPRGKHHGRTVLTEEQVLEIFNLFITAPPYRGRRAALARKYGVSAVAIGKVWNGDNWSHLTGAGA